MYRTVNIPKGNSFSLYIPVLNSVSGGLQPVQTSTIENLTVLVGNIERSIQGFTVGRTGNYISITFPPTLEVSTYSVIIDGVYCNQSISIRIQGAFNIVEWSNLQRGNNYIPGQDIMLEPQVLIGCYLTSEDLEELKRRYEILIRLTEEEKLALERAKQEFIEKAIALDGVAKQTTLLEVKESIRDTAKQGTDPNVTITTLDGKIGQLDEILQDINGDNIDGIINSYMDDYAEQLQDIIGTID